MMLMKIKFSGFQTNHHFQYNYKHHKLPLIFVKLTFQLLASSRYRIYQHKCIQRGLQYLGVLQPTSLKNYILRRRVTSCKIQTFELIHGALMVVLD